VEMMLVEEPLSRRLFKEYFHYMPEAGSRRRWLLFLNACFVGSFFAFTCSAIVLGFHTFPTVVKLVLAIELGSFHLYKAVQGEWAHEYGNMPFAVSLLGNTIMWLMPRFCPVWTMRLPNTNVGPHLFAFTIACGFVESACFAALSLLSTDSPTHEQERLILWAVCVPAGSAALASLAGFMLVMEPTYRASFWRYETRAAFWRRWWTNDGYVPGNLDHSRAHMLSVSSATAALLKRCPELVRTWLAEGLPRWREEQPEWLTREWWEALPLPLREGLVFEPNTMDGDMSFSA